MDEHDFFFDERTPILIYRKFFSVPYFYSIFLFDFQEFIIFTV